MRVSDDCRNCEYRRLWRSGGVELDLEAVEDDLSTPFLEYDPSNYHGLYVRLEEGGPLITVYRSGKYIISGCPGEKKNYERPTMDS